jgi:ribonuclease BN (tRNA processing enzyme)
MSDLQLTPIGTSPAWYNPGEANSGFLLEADGVRVLVDCGSGVIARYLELYGTEAPIDAIVLTHVHADHCFDLVPLKFGLTIGSLRGWPMPQLWVPPMARERLTRLVSTWDADFDFFGDTFDVHDYTPGLAFNVGPLQVRAIEVPHYVESFALRFEHGAASFGYSSDLGPSEHIVPFMSGVDLLLSEAALDEAADLSAPDRGHITAAEAGQIAAGAGVGRLLLTHVPQELGFERAMMAARAEFAGPVDHARSGKTVHVSQVLRTAG